MIRFNNKVSANDLKSAIEEYGYAVVENVLDKDYVSNIKNQIDDLSAEFEPKKKSKFLGSKTVRFGRLLWRLPQSSTMVNHPLVRNVLDEILLQYSPAYHLSFTGVMYLKEGQKAQVLHRDNTIFENTPNTPINLVATMWAIEDFKKDNGATVIVPGSHKWSEDRVPTKEELVAAEMPAGSVLFYAGNLIHGSGTCKYGSRLGVSVQYNLSWMTQEEPQFLAIPQEFAKNHFDEDLLKLIGYNIVSRNCGEIDSEHLLDFLLKDNKQRGLDAPGSQYANGKCKSLFFTVGSIRQHDCHYDVVLDD